MRKAVVDAHGQACGTLPFRSLERGVEMCNLTATRAMVFGLLFCFGVASEAADGNREKRGFAHGAQPTGLNAFNHSMNTFSSFPQEQLHELVNTNGFQSAMSHENLHQFLDTVHDVFHNSPSWNPPVRCLGTGCPGFPRPGLPIMESPPSSQ